VPDVESSRPALDLAAGSSPGQLLALIRSRDGWTRQQLLDEVGVSRTTLFERLELLFGAELVHDAGPLRSTGGRPARLLRFNDRGRVVLAVDLGHTRARIAVTDLYGRELRVEANSVDVASGPGPVLDELCRVADALLANGADERLIGFGMGVPCHVSPQTQRILPTPVMPGWDQYPILDMLRRRWGVPVLLVNDAHALALGEASAAEGTDTLVVVKYAHGVGAGVVAAGRLLGGVDGAAGDIGHIRVGDRDHGPRCGCGRKGCLATYASGHALLHTLGHLGVRNLDDIADLAWHGNAKADHALRDAAGMLGQVLAAVVTTVNPRVLVLSGILGRLPVVVRTVAARVRSDALPRATHGLNIIPGQLGERAATTGLTRMVVDHVYAPTTIDALVTAPSSGP
jgi:predicted NBD/HSP70 family sugar kinase